MIIDIPNTSAGVVAATTTTTAAAIMPTTNTGVGSIITITTVNGIDPTTATISTMPFTCNSVLSNCWLESVQAASFRHTRRLSYQLHSKISPLLITQPLLPLLLYFAATATTAISVHVCTVMQCVHIFQTVGC